MADTSIRVIARFRPISEREKREIVEGKESVQLEFRDEQTVQLNQGVGKEPLLWTFDRVFHGRASQADIFNLAAKETAEDVMKGYNGTIFAYGQTGSGKSHTMMGPDIVSEELCGIIPRACQFIFEHIARNPDHCEFKVTCSFLEIYKEVIKDLLNPKGINLKVRETPTRGVWVEGLSETEVDSHLRVLALLRQGEEHRAVASTNMNSVSSRSHSLFILTVTQKTREGATKIGKLNLADLAGSEKVGKTGASGETLEEAKKINQSLSALGNCIMALTKHKKQHVPYRDSKLTFILRESLGGNTKTTLLIACSPHSFNLEETISTLRFGQRAKAIKNKVKINAQRSVAELELIVKKLTKEVKVLKKYSTRLEQELSKLKIEGLDFDAIKRQLFEEASASSLKLSKPDLLANASPQTPSRSGNGNDSGEEDEEEEDDERTASSSGTPQALRTPSKNGMHQDDDLLSPDFADSSISLPSSPNKSNGFIRAMIGANTGPGSPLTRSATAHNLKTPNRTPGRFSAIRDDFDVMSNASSTNTTPTRPTLFLDGIENEDGEAMALLDAQLEYNRMKENLNLQIQDLNDEIAQANEERETLLQQNRIQVAKLSEENSQLKAEIAALKAQLSSTAASTSTGTAANLATPPRPSSSPLRQGRQTPSPAATDSPVVPHLSLPSSSSPTPGMRRNSLRGDSPRAPITIPLDGSSPLRREASDPVFMTRQMFHWMVLATKLEMFSQGHMMRYDIDFETMFRELVESNVSTQGWPKKIMKALEAPTTPKTPTTPHKDREMHSLN